MSTKKKPKIQVSKEGWIVKGYADFIEGSFGKRAPSKDLDKKARDQLTPREEQYLDGYNQAKDDKEKGLI